MSPKNKLILLTKKAPSNRRFFYFTIELTMIVFYL